MEWRDIDTAPKDGTIVVVYCPDGITTAKYLLEWGWRLVVTGDFATGDSIEPTMWYCNVPKPGGLGK